MLLEMADALDDRHQLQARRLVPRTMPEVFADGLGQRVAVPLDRFLKCVQMPAPQLQRRRAFAQKRGALGLKQHAGRGFHPANLHWRRRPVQAPAG